MSYNRKYHNENILVLYYAAMLFMLYLLVICRAVLSMVTPNATYEDIIDPVQLDIML